MNNTVIINDLDDNIRAAKSTFVNEAKFCIKYLGDISNQITVLSQNIRSISKNLDYLTVFIKKLNFSPDLIILTECWLLDSNTAFNLNNYEQYNSKQYFNKNDGIVIYFRRDLNINITEPSFLDANCLLLELDKSVSILCIYRSPSFKNIDNFLNSLEDQIKNCKSENCFIVGDINPDIKNNTNDIKLDEYLNLTAQYGFIPGHTLPTRGPNCLDHVFIKSRLPTFVVICRSDISDHESVLFTIRNDKQNTVSPKQTYSKKINYAQITKDLQLTDWSRLYEHTNANTATDEFVNIINRIVTKHTELRPVHRSVCILKPWMTTSLIKSVKKRDRLHISVRKNPNDLNILVNYKNYRNTCNNIIQNLKDEYNRNKLLKSKGDCKKTWDVLKEICHLNTKKSNQRLITNSSQPKRILNEANNYFCTIGENLATNILQESGKTESELAKSCLTHVIGNNSQHSFFLTPTDEIEIFKLISNLKNRSTGGLDNITNELLKKCKLVLASPIAFLCNLSLSTGTVPYNFKIANVCPILKDGDPSEVSNYRPISLLSCLSKIVEKVVNKRLLNYLELNNLLSENQYGFRANRSTEDAVTELTDYVTTKLDKGSKCIGVFLDLAKAFDTLSRKILIAKLEALGVRGIALKWFQSYLTNRKQKVSVAELSSDLAKVNFGVPQGSVLGPTLFLIYINDLCSLNLKQAKLFTFADDTAVVFCGDSWDSAERLTQQGLQEVFSWLRNNLLTINTSKTKFISFKISTRTDPITQLKIKLHTCPDYHNKNCQCPIIEQVSHLKYLGVVLDEGLRWDKQAHALSGRLRKLMFIFKRLRNVASAEVLKLVYESFCQSILNYCLPAWGGAGKTYLLKVERAQRAVLKAAYKKPFRYPTDSLYSECGFLRVRQLYVKSVILRFHKSAALTVITRSRLQRWRCPFLRTQFARRSYLFAGPFLYTKVNRAINIMVMSRFKCKQSVNKWLIKSNYEDMEKFLKLV